MKVLAIEDQPMAGLQLMATLRSLGHDAELVTDGESAWQKLQQGAYRVVVSDWRMPGLDGLQFCRRVRQRGGEYVYFILISTTKVTRETREEALQAGVDDFLVKPVDPDELGMRLHVAGRIIAFAAQVRQLESFLPICGYCKKVRDDQQYWQDIEGYLSERQGTRLSHSICPDCYNRIMLPQLNELGIKSPKLEAKRAPEARPRVQQPE